MKEIKHSSNIEAVGHEGGTLTIKFRNGGIYDYPDFPAELHDKFVNAESCGKFFQGHIRGKYMGTKRETEK